MRPIDLHFLERPGIRIKGELYDSLDVDVLLQDLLEIDMPGDTTIDVGWYPEHDPSGNFRVRCHEGNNESMQASADTPSEALDIVKAFVELQFPDRSVSSIHQLKVDERQYA